MISLARVLSSSSSLPGNCHNEDRAGRERALEQRRTTANPSQQEELSKMPARDIAVNNSGASLLSIRWRMQWRCSEMRRLCGNDGTRAPYSSDMTALSRCQAPTLLPLDADQPWTRTQPKDAWRPNPGGEAFNAPSSGSSRPHPLCTRMSEGIVKMAVSGILPCLADLVTPTGIEPVFQP